RPGRAGVKRSADGRRPVRTRGTAGPAAVDTGGARSPRRRGHTAGTRFPGGCGSTARTGSGGTGPVTHRDVSISGPRPIPCHRSPVHSSRVRTPSGDPAESAPEFPGGVVEEWGGRDIGAERGEYPNGDVYARPTLRLP